MTSSTSNTEREVTVICVAYKRYCTIHTLIRSFLCQTLDNWKLLVIHDGPDERMEAIIREYQKECPHIEYLGTVKRYNDYGHSLREIGLRRAQTEYLMFTNDDNYYIPKFLELMFESIRRQKLDLVLCDMIHGHKNPGRYRQPAHGFFRSFPRYQYIDIGNFIVRREIAQEVGFADKSFEADGHFIRRIMENYRVINRIHDPRWLFHWWFRARKNRHGRPIQVGKVSRVLFVHN